MRINLIRIKDVCDRNWMPGDTGVGGEMDKTSISSGLFAL